MYGPEDEEKGDERHVGDALNSGISVSVSVDARSTWSVRREG